MADFILGTEFEPKSQQSEGILEGILAPQGNRAEEALNPKFVQCNMGPTKRRYLEQQG
jgi:hypothetical protein